MKRWTTLLACLSVAAGAGLPMTRAQAAGGTLPAHLFAPYFEAYTSDSPAQLSAQSGARYLTLAFLQTPAAGSCVIDWNGNAHTPVASSTYGADIASIRAAGGDVIPSFGGYSADHDGTEIADSCASVPAIAAAYEKVITTYNVSRLDFDVEDRSLTNRAGITRRNKAMAMVASWAAAQHRTVQFVYTLPSGTGGIGSNGQRVLQSAVTYHAPVTVVNIMTFDYYDGQPHEMAADTETAAGHLYSTLHALYPSQGSAALWAMIGVTEMIGIDDFGPAETFTLKDASTIEQWAAGTGLAELSFWALERDNGGCPGMTGRGDCSGVAQSQWQFSHTFEPFTG